MKVLIACEESQTVCKAFRERGHEAYSCDIIPCSGGHPEWHIQDDAIKVAYSQHWDLMIAHPPCTYLATCAEWAYKDEPYHQKVKAGTLVGKQRREAREQALIFVKKLLNIPIKKIAVENPIGVISSRIFWHTEGRYEIFPTRTIGCIAPQVIQPYMFGENASKATCIYLKGLPELQPTLYINPRIVNGMKRWENQTDSGQNRLPPTNDRAKKRSVTFQGIADAMANQWGKELS